MKHLLSITDLSTDEIHSILHLAGRMHQLQEARINDALPEVVADLAERGKIGRAHV